MPDVFSRSLTRLKKLKDSLSRWQDLGPFLARVSLGVVFAQSGFGKLTNLERTARFFESLGIPAPELQAMFIGGLELVGGTAIVFGLLTRLVALPLMATMVVAIFTALLPDVEGVLDLLALSETLYIALLVLFITQGPGRWSLDFVLERRLVKNVGPTNASA